MVKKIKSLVVGLGNIGLGNTNNNKVTELLSHCANLNESKLYDLIYAIDKNEKKRKICENKYKITTFDKISSIPNKTLIDLIIISVPTKFHFTVTKNLIKKFKPKVILIEKPFCDNLKKAMILKKLCEKNKIKTFVNYPRRILPELKNIRKLIKNRLTKGKIVISNGLINNGCHFIDLCNFLFGNYIKIKKYGKLSYLKSFNDYSRNFRIYYPYSYVDFEKQNHKKNFFEVNLVNDFIHLKWSQTIKNLNNIKVPKMKLKIFYKKKNIKKSININIRNYQKNVYLEIANYFKKKKNNILSSLKDAILVKKIINEVIN